MCIPYQNIITTVVAKDHQQAQRVIDKMGVFTGMGGKGEMQGLAVEVSFKVTRKKEYQVWAENGLTSDILAQLKEWEGLLAHHHKVPARDTAGGAHGWRERNCALGRNMQAKACLGAYL